MIAPGLSFAETLTRLVLKTATRLSQGFGAAKLDADSRYQQYLTAYQSASGLRDRRKLHILLDLDGDVFLDRMLYHPHGVALAEVLLRDDEFASRLSCESLEGLVLISSINQAKQAGGSGIVVELREDITRISRESGGHTHFIGDVPSGDLAVILPFMARFGPPEYLSRLSEPLLVSELRIEQASPREWRLTLG